MGKRGRADIHADDLLLLLKQRLQTIVPPGYLVFPGHELRLRGINITDRNDFSVGEFGEDWEVDGLTDGAETDDGDTNLFHGGIRRLGGDQFESGLAMF